MKEPTPPERVYTYPPGAPAIQPRITGADASTAAYTEADVRQYLAAHPAFPTTDGTEPVIAELLFIPASQARALRGVGWIGRPDTTLVCYVEVHGNLSTSWMRRPPRARVPSTAHVGVLVFDAQTGNVLLRGLGAFQTGVPAAEIPCNSAGASWRRRTDGESMDE